MRLVWIDGLYAALLCARETATYEVFNVEVQRTSGIWTFWLPQILGGVDYVAVAADGLIVGWFLA